MEINIIATHFANGGTVKTFYEEYPDSATDPVSLDGMPVTLQVTVGEVVKKMVQQIQEAKDDVSKRN